MDTITLNGRTYEVEIERDADAGPPWEEDESHGVVSDLLYRDKHPGERVLADDDDGHWKRFYDVAASIRIARRDSWGLDAVHHAALAARLGRAPSAREVTAEAVELDYDFLRRWCRDDWQYVIVVVTEPASGETDALGGVEDSDPAYVDKIVHELVGNIEHRLAHAADQARRRDILVITRSMLR